MKIVFISDTHDQQLTSIDVPDGDILCFTGDICGSDTMATYERFNSWLGSLPHAKKIIIPGNHDFLAERDPGLFKDTMFYATTLIHEHYEYAGAKFFGSPYQTWFHDWAFNVKLDNEREKLWGDIEEDTDITLIHCPPYKVLDEVQYSHGRDPHVGCKPLRKKLMQVKPIIAAHGHIHEAYGTLEHMDILFINSCICNENYKPHNAPIVVEIAENLGKWHVINYWKGDKIGSNGN